MNGDRRRLDAVILRHAWAIAAVLVTFHAVLAWVARGPGIYSDQAVYLSLARALGEFHYRELFRIDLPFHRMYPPGFPFALAVWSAVGGERFEWLVLVSIASSAGALLLFFAAVRSIWGTAIALAALLALSFNPALVAASGWLLTEAPFMFFSALTLWALAPGRHPLRSAAVAGAAAIAGALTRSAGVTLVIALVAYWSWNRQYRKALVLGGVATLIVGGWLMFTAGAPQQVVGSSYIADAAFRPPGVSLVQAIVTRMSAKLPYLEHVYWQLPVPAIPGSAIDNVIAVPLATAAILVGMWALAGQWPAAAVYVAAYAMLLAAWPWMLERFVTPVVPWLVLAAVLGVHSAVGMVSASWQTRAAVVVSGLLTLSGIAGVAGVVGQRQLCDRTAALPSRACLNQSWGDYFAAVDYIRARVPSGATFASAEPATLYLYTGHRAAASPMDAEYILLSTAGASPDEMVVANCRKLRLEASFPTAYLFRVPGSTESEDAQRACAAAHDFVELSRVPAR